MTVTWNAAITLFSLTVTTMEYACFTASGMRCRAVSISFPSMRARAASMA